MSRDEGLFFQRDFSAAELSTRRRRVMAEMGGGVAVVAAAPEVPGFDPVRQDNDFYYLTGVETPHAYLIMDASAGDGGRSTIYLPPRNPKHEASDGPSLSDEDAAFVLNRTGIEEVRSIHQLAKDLTDRAGTLWVFRTPAENARQCQDSLRHYAKSRLSDPLDGQPTRSQHLMAKLSQLSPRTEFRDLAPIVHRHRLTKSPAEAEVMRAAGKLTALATIEAMKATRPGVTEFQLGAVAEYVYQANGARGVGYRPIIATDGNIHMMHYWRNNSACVDGGWVLFDCAPDYNYYTSDIGRMWPVNGSYSALQRELYGFVLQFHKVLLQVVRPGKTKDELRAEAAAKIMPLLESWPWSKAIYRQAALNMVNSPRPLSHAVGMAVHDSADWADRPVEPGLVFAVDPEMFIPEEQGYVRVEDTVLVTESGCENLTALCPFEIEEVERLMTQSGILQSFPPVHTNPGR